MNYLLIIFSIFIAALGFMGARYYEKSSHPAKDQRTAFCYFSAYVFGVAPLLFMLVNMGADMLAKRSPTKVMRARLHFSLYAFMAIFTIALAAMLINDMRDDTNRDDKQYGMSVFVLIVALLVFIYAGVVVAIPDNKYKLMDKFEKITGFEGGPVSGFGGYEEDFYPHMFGFGRQRRRARK